jgi:glycosyltransferase involved in cell wall biosynthesis
MVCNGDGWHEQIVDDGPRRAFASATQRNDARPSGAIVRIAVDVRSLMDQPTGIGRYTAQLVAHLQLRHDVVLFAFGGERPSGVLARLAQQPRTRLIRSPVPMRVMRQFWRTLRAPSLENLTGAVDVVVASETTMPVCTAPVVAVVYDCLWARHPEWFNHYVRRAGPENLADVAAGAAVVVTISAASQDEIVRLQPSIAARLHIVTPAVAPVPLALPARRDRGSILFVGTLEPRKGLAVVARALLRAVGPASRAKLVVIGGGGWGGVRDDGALSLLIDQGRCDVLGYADDDVVARWRDRATLAVVPALDEGFGLPLLEALAAGVPTAASAVPVFSEVGGDAFVGVPAGDADEWADALDSLLDDDGARARLGCAGPPRAASFSIERQRQALDDALAALGFP